MAEGVPSSTVLPSRNGVTGLSPGWSLSADRLAVLAKVERLSRESFAPRAPRYDAEASFPFENYRDLHEAGLLAMTVPEAYGGLGLDRLTYALALAEIAKGCSSTALTFNMHATVLRFLDQLGTEAQKRRYFSEVVKEGKLIASIGSEPGSSFRDKFVFRTTFRPVAGGFQVSGLKFFCSLGDAADYYLVTGIIEGTTSAHEGALSAMIRREDAGVTIEQPWNATGMRGTTSHTIRYNCVVDQRDIVGKPGSYLTVDLSGFGLGYAATYLGIAEAAFEFFIEYAQSKGARPGIEPMVENPVIQRAVAEMGTSIRAARLLLGEAALQSMWGDKQAAVLAINQAKFAAGEAGVRVTEQAIRLAGGSGILKSLPLERWHRDALAGPVMPPSSDRCLQTIGRLLFGLEAATLEFQ